MQQRLYNKYTKGALVLLLYGTIIITFWRIIPQEYYVDWIYALRPAVREMLAGKTPYSVSGVYNPPWTFIALIPLALFPPKIGAILLTFITFTSLIIIARRLGSSTIIAISFITIPFIAIKAVINPNIDFLAAFGLILPPQIGLFFLVMKPQIGFAVALYWLIEAGQRGGWKEILRVFAPVSIAFVISILIFGPYFLKALNLINQESLWYVYPIWPYTIPVGLSILAFAIARKEFNFSISASPFLSPYVASYTYSFAILGLVNHKLLYFSAYVGLWLIYLIQRFSSSSS